MFYATIKYFNNQNNPIIKLHSFATAEDRAAWIAADGYDADHGHRKVAAGKVNPSAIATLLPVSELAGPADAMARMGCERVYGSDHRVGTYVQ